MNIAILDSDKQDSKFLSEIITKCAKMEYYPCSVECFEDINSLESVLLSNPITYDTVIYSPATCIDTESILHNVDYIGIFVILLKDEELPKELNNSIAKYIFKLNLINTDNILPYLFYLNYEIAAKNYTFSKYEKRKIFCASDIEFFHMSNCFFTVYFIDGRIKKVNRSLSEIEQQLDKRFFVRTHKSFIVNLQYIESHDNLMLKLKGNVNIPIQKNLARRVIKRYHRFDNYINNRYQKIPRIMEELPDSN